MKHKYVISLNPSQQPEQSMLVQHTSKGITQLYTERTRPCLRTLGKIKFQGSFRLVVAARNLSVQNENIDLKKLKVEATE